MESHKPYWSTNGAKEHGEEFRSNARCRYKNLKRWRRVNTTLIGVVGEDATK